MPPVVRQPLDAEDLEESQAEDDSHIGGWRGGTVQPDDIPFTGRSGLLVNVGGDTPLDYFSLMVNQTMIEGLVVETNRSEQTLRGKVLSPRSRFCQWVDVTAVEMRAFLGLIIGMGLIVITNMLEYWSLHDLYKLPFFSSVMVKDRFFSILSFFHVADNGNQLPRDHPQFDPLYKIRTWVDSLNQNFTTTFASGRNIAIDEAIVAWRGPLSFRTYNPDKPNKYGMKVFDLCDSNTAYCCKLQFCTGKRKASPRCCHLRRRGWPDCSLLRLRQDLVRGQLLHQPDIVCILEGAWDSGLRHYEGEQTERPSQGNAAKALTDGTLNYPHFMDREEVRILTTAHAGDTMVTGKTNPVTKEPIVKLSAVNY